MQRRFITRLAMLASVSAAALAAQSSASAQSAVDAAREVIVVTATKRAGGVNVQDAPVAMTAYSETQLDALHFRDLEDLSYSMPNVQFNDIATARGVANFSIRGVGINSSIPSIDPTVGVFVDGVYLGLNAGVVIDTFDLEGIEVLRGPQGLLFGRNVTGGAVLINTKAPSTDGFEVNGKFAVETGLNYYAMGSASGPLDANGTIAAKLAVYYNNDEGWFHNQYDNNDNFGAAETTIIRPSILWAPNDSLDTILRYEHGDSSGDGPAAQNNAIFDRNSFGFSVNDTGFYDSSWDLVTSETNWQVGFGDGTITNVFGWRDYGATTEGDIDALPFTVFHSQSSTDHNQWSDELRYSGTFFDGIVDLTTGVYYLKQELEYRERRNVPPASFDGTGGGGQDQSTTGVFAQTDTHMTDTLTFTLGLRWTSEEKSAAINPIPIAACAISGPCALVPGYTEVGSREWNNTSAKIGFEYEPQDDLLVYGSYTTGFRSGGFNMRNTDLLPGGPFDEEQVASLEFGFKSDFADGRFRLNGAAFHNEITDMQREINTPGALGVTQRIRNTADATLKGFEFDAQATLTDSLLVMAQLGYVDDHYDDIRTDLTGDGVVNSADYALRIPRVAKWTYGVSVAHDLSLDQFGSLTSLISFNHRDKAFYTDNNLGYLNPADMLDASFTFEPASSENWSFSIYGRNLLSEVQHGNDTQLPSSFGGPGASFSPLAKGTVLGAEVQFRH